MIPPGPVTHPSSTTPDLDSDVGGSLGTDRSGGAWPNPNALVRSPVTDRRHALRLGTATRKRRSRKRSVEVWSKRSEQTKPPRLNGDTTIIGTRKPRPIGPRT